MSNHKGVVATLLTLGLVLVGTLITLGTSLFVSNSKTNLASNSMAYTNPCNGPYTCPAGRTGDYYSRSGTMYADPGCYPASALSWDQICKPSGGSTAPPPPNNGGSGTICSGTGYTCRTNDCIDGEIEVTNRQCTGKVCCYKGTSQPAAPTNTGKLNGPCYATGSRCDTGLKCVNAKCVVDSSANPVPPSRDDTGGSGIVGPGQSCCFEKTNGLIYVFSRYEDMVNLEMNLNCAAHSVERSYQAIGPAFVCNGSIQNQTPRDDIDPVDLTDGAGDGGTNDDGFIDDIIEDTPPAGYTNCQDYGPGECNSNECRADYGQNYQCVSGRFCCTKSNVPPRDIPLVPNCKLMQYNFGHGSETFWKSTDVICASGANSSKCYGLGVSSTESCKKYTWTELRDILIATYDTSNMNPPAIKCSNPKEECTNWKKGVKGRYYSYNKYSTGTLSSYYKEENCIGRGVSISADPDGIIKYCTSAVPAGGEGTVTADCTMTRENTIPYQSSLTDPNGGCYLYWVSNCSGFTNGWNCISMKK